MWTFQQLSPWDGTENKARWALETTRKEDVHAASLTGDIRGTGEQPVKTACLDTASRVC